MSFSYSQNQAPGGTRERNFAECREYNDIDINISIIGRNQDV